MLKDAGAPGRLMPIIDLCVGGTGDFTLWMKNQPMSLTQATGNDVNWFLFSMQLWFAKKALTFLIRGRLILSCWIKLFMTKGNESVND